ncbi:non-homologous end-joining DNA ligase [Bradyrhizobium diazoefficiens]|uniref:non-homologous end-joining DNA ligase n=1 Tax=Bradyrhizobium diazoefficiens TaxID=1355477 RepID=UPI0034E4D1F7
MKKVKLPAVRPLTAGDFCELRRVAKRTRAAMPGFIKPQLATLKTKAPAGEDWIHEIKYDGYRIQLHIDGDTRKAFTRNGHDWIKRFSTIAGAFDLPYPAIIDGEVVVVHEGRTNFSELQAELAGGRQDRLQYYAFDLLWLDGQDLRKTSQLARKELLKELFETHCIEPPALYSEHAEGDGHELFKAAARLNFEGIVSKRVDAPYRSERTEAWWKVKTVHRDTFPVVGFVKDPSGVAALYLGKQDGKELRYIGKVGTGWSRTRSAEIRKALNTVVSPKTKLTRPIRKPKATWVEPLFFAEVEYRDITSEGLLRASSFRGLTRK